MRYIYLFIVFMTPITISIPDSIGSNYFMTSLDQYYTDIIKLAHLQQKADALFQEAKTVFVDEKKRERARIEESRQAARDEHFSQKK